MDQLAHWINGELGVEPKVAFFETQFSNGVMFGRVLHKLGVLDDAQLESLRDSLASAAKRRNFAVLIPAIRSMGVRIEKQIVEDIETEQRGAAVKLMQRVREATSKYIPPSQRRDARRRSELASRARSRTSSRRPGSSSSSLTSHRPLTVETAVSKGKSRNEVWQAAHMAKFEEQQAAMEERADKAELAERLLLQRETKRRHDSMRLREQTQRQWRREFEHAMADESSKLRAWQRDRERESLAVELGVWAKQKAQKQVRRDADAQDMRESLAAMERNLLQLGLADDVDDDDPVELDDAERAVLFSELHQSRRETASERAVRIRQRLAETLHPDESEAFFASLRVRARREAIARRDQATRRRLQSAAQRSTQQELDTEANTKADVDRYLRQARVERVAARQKWNMLAQMKLRDAQRQEAIGQREEKRTATVVNSLRHKEKGTSRRPYNDPVRVARRAAVAAETRRKHAEATELVSPVVDELVSLVLDVLPYLEETEEVRDGIRERGVPPNVWRDWKRAFIRGSYGLALRQARKESSEAAQQHVMIAGGWGLVLPDDAGCPVARVTTDPQQQKKEGEEDEGGHDDQPAMLLSFDGIDATATRFSGSDAVVWALAAAAAGTKQRPPVSGLQPVPLTNGEAMRKIQRRENVSFPVDPDVLFLGHALSQSWCPTPVPAEFERAWKRLHALSVWSDAVPKTHPPLSQLLSLESGQSDLLRSVPLTLAAVPEPTNLSRGHWVISILGQPKCGSSRLAGRVAARNHCGRVIDQESIVEDSIQFFVWSERRRKSEGQEEEEDEEKVALRHGRYSFGWAQWLSGEARSTLWVIGRAFLLAAGGEAAVDGALRHLVIPRGETRNERRKNDEETQHQGVAKEDGNGQDDADVIAPGDDDGDVESSPIPADPVPIEEAWTIAWERAKEARAAWLGDWDIGVGDKGTSSTAAGSGGGKKGGAGGKKGSGKKGDSSPRGASGSGNPSLQRNPSIPVADQVRDSRTWRMGLSLSVLAGLRRNETETFGASSCSSSSLTSFLVLDDVPLSQAEWVAVELPSALDSALGHSPLLTHVPGFLDHVTQETLDPLTTVPACEDDDGTPSPSYAVARGRVASWTDLFQWLCRADDSLHDGSWNVPDPTADPLDPETRVSETPAAAAAGKGGKQAQSTSPKKSPDGSVVVPAPLRPTPKVPMSDSAVRLWVSWGKTEEETEEGGENGEGKEEEEGGEVGGEGKSDDETPTTACSYWGRLIGLPKDFRPPAVDEKSAAAEGEPQEQPGEENVDSETDHSSPKKEDGRETEAAATVPYPIAERNRRWKESSSFRDLYLRPLSNNLRLPLSNAKDDDGPFSMAEDEASLRETFPGLGKLWIGRGLREYAAVKEAILSFETQARATMEEDVDDDEHHDDVEKRTEQENSAREGVEFSAQDLWRGVVRGSESLRSLARGPLLLAMWWKRERSAQTAMQIVATRWRDIAVGAETACFQRGKRFLEALSQRDPCPMELEKQNEEDQQQKGMQVGQTGGKGDIVDGVTTSPALPMSPTSTRTMSPTTGRNRTTRTGLTNAQLAASAARRGADGVLHRAHVPPNIHPLRRPRVHRTTPSEKNLHHHAGDDSRKRQGGELGGRWPGEERLHRVLMEWRRSTASEKPLSSSSGHSRDVEWRKECIECVDTAWSAVERRWSVARSILQSWEEHRIRAIRGEGIVGMALMAVDVALQRAVDRLFIGRQLCRSNLVRDDVVPDSATTESAVSMKESLKRCLVEQSRWMEDEERGSPLLQLRKDLCNKCEAVGHAWDGALREWQASQSPLPAWLLRFAHDEMERTISNVLETCFAELRALLQLDEVVHAHCRESVSQWVRLVDQRLRDIRTRVGTETVPSANLVHMTQRICPDVSNGDVFGAVATGPVGKGGKGEEEDEEKAAVSEAATGFAAVLSSDMCPTNGQHGAHFVTDSDPTVSSEWLQSAVSGSNNEGGITSAPVLPSLASLWSRHILGHDSLGVPSNSKNVSPPSPSSSSSLSLSVSASQVASAGVSAPLESPRRGMASGRDQLALVPDQVEPPVRRNTRPLSPGLQKRLRETVGETALARRSNLSSTSTTGRPHGTAHPSRPSRPAGSGRSPLFAPLLPFVSAKWSPAGFQALCNAIRTVWMQDKNEAIAKGKTKQDVEDNHDADHASRTNGLLAAVALVGRALRVVVEHDATLVPPRWRNSLTASETNPPSHASPLRECLERCSRGAELVDSFTTTTLRMNDSADAWTRRIVQRFVVSLATTSFVPTVPTLWQWIVAWVSLAFATRPRSGADAEGDEDADSIQQRRDSRKIDGSVSRTEWKHVRFPWEIPPEQAAHWVTRAVHRSAAPSASSPPSSPSSPSSSFAAETATPSHRRYLVWCGFHSTEEEKTQRREAIALLAQETQRTAATVRGSAEIEESFQALRASLAWIYGHQWHRTNGHPSCDNDDDEDGDEKEAVMGKDDGDPELEAGMSREAKDMSCMDVGLLFQDWMHVTLGGVPGVPPTMGGSSTRWTRSVIWSDAVRHAVNMWGLWRRDIVKTVWDAVSGKVPGDVTPATVDAACSSLWPVLEDCPYSERRVGNRDDDNEEDGALPWLGDAGVYAE